MEHLFEEWAGEPCLKKTPIAANGSNRQYFRLEGSTHTCVGARSGDVRENDAFFFYAKEMHKRGIRVPKLYAVSVDHTNYLQEDLGDDTVYNYLHARRAGGLDVEEETREIYKKIIDDLVVIQTKCRNIDFSHSYPRPAFDAQSIHWDLNYFKYHFLKLLYIPFDEQLLEDDFNRFTDYLLDTNCGYFLYRDFQARNIMIFPNGELYYIDFQGARQGAPQYDLASLLYSSKSELSETLREELLDYYIAQFYKRLRGETRKAFDPNQFKQKFYGYVLARMMQAMGAYGYRGMYEKKDYFMKSIPLAVTNLRNVIRHHELSLDIPHLKKVWQTIADHEDFQPKDNRLSVKIFSFSYKKGIPVDKSGNGGGFVFDCRALPNPGKYEEFKHLTGRDQSVKDFLAEKEEMSVFLQSTFTLVDQAVEKYMERGFTSLMVCFGCTGGQHRSVYSAEQMAQHIRQKYDCRVVLRHREQDNDPSFHKK